MNDYQLNNSMAFGYDGGTQSWIFSLQTESDKTPSDWNRYKIKDLVAFIKSGLSRAILFDDIGIPVITSTNVVDGQLDTTELKYWYKKDPQGANINEYILDGGDILLNFINSTSQIGKACIFRDIGRPTIYTTNIFRIKITDKVLPEFFLLLLQSQYVQHWIQLITKPAINQASFTKPDFTSIPVFVPLIHEQKAIVTVLDSISTEIELREKLIAKLKQIKVGLLHNLLTCGLDEHGQLRDPVAHPGQFKDTEVGRIPKTWGVSSLAEVALNGISNGFFKKPEAVGSGFRLINVLDLYQDFGINLDMVERVKATQQELRRYAVQLGDCFFTRSSLNLTGIAQCNIIRNVTEPTLFECHLMRVRPDQSKINPVFFAHWCRSSFAHTFFMSCAKQVTMTTISQPDIAPLPLPLPSHKEQDMIVELIDNHEQRISFETVHLAKLKKLKKGLMNDLLIGKVRVKIDED